MQRFPVPRLRSVAIASLGLVSLGAALPAQAMDLASHRAGYRLELERGGAQARDVVGASGAMVFEIIDQCDGWTVQQRLSLAITDRDGRTVETVTDYVTWETRDGTQLRFRLRQNSAEAVSQNIQGEATLEANGSGGQVRYRSPTEDLVPLPAGTLFPTTHTVKLLERAFAGERILAAPLFDGTSDDGAQDSSSLVLSRAEPTPHPRFPVLSTEPSFRTRIGFFEPGDSQPSYEVTMRYFRNGIADEIRMDFGTFAVAGALDSLQVIPSTCPPR